MTRSEQHEGFDATNEVFAFDENKDNRLVFDDLLCYNQKAFDPFFTR